ncbi:MAG: helix-turn-helix transcriptional regulator [Pseudomonadota bacterium]
MTEKTTSPVRKRFAEQLKHFRKEAGFKRARAFAQALGIDENRYTRYERAEVEPSLTLIMQICGKLDVSPNTLFGLGPTEPEAHAAPAPGFGDSAHGAGAFGSGDDLPVASAVKAQAWQAAKRFVASGAPTGKRGCAPGTTEFDDIAAIAETYDRIIGDPFGAVSALLAEAKASGVADNERAVLARLLADVAESASRTA